MLAPQLFVLPPSGFQETMSGKMGVLSSPRIPYFLVCEDSQPPSLGKLAQMVRVKEKRKKTGDKVGACLPSLIHNTEIWKNSAHRKVSCISSGRKI